MNQWMGHFLSYLQEKASGLGLGVDAEFVETVLAQVQEFSLRSPFI